MLKEHLLNWRSADKYGCKPHRSVLSGLYGLGLLLTQEDSKNRLCGLLEPQIFKKSYFLSRVRAKPLYISL
jgi:hypothetical protein